MIKSEHRVVQAEYPVIGRSDPRPLWELRIRVGRRDTAQDFVDHVADVFARTAIQMPAILRVEIAGGEHVDVLIDDGFEYSTFINSIRLGAMLGGKVR